MKLIDFSKILKTKRVFIFVGQTGSGKTELSLNFATQISKYTDKTIHFIDMDQTKPMYRSRDMKEQLSNNRIVFNKTLDEVDSFAIADGIKGSLMDKNVICILDVGGNEIGSTMIAQFKDYTNSEDVSAYFVINTLRPFSQSKEDVLDSIKYISGSAELKSIKIISNPCLGTMTTPELIIENHRILENYLHESDYEIEIISADKKNITSKFNSIKQYILPIDLYIKHL